MDTTQLNKHLKLFIAACADRGYPIDRYCLVDSLHGVSNGIYNLQIKSDVLNKKICSEALEILIDILFDTTSAAVREKIFYIQVLDEDEDVSCFSPTSESLVPTKVTI